MGGLVVLVQRHSWIWAVLAPDCRLIRCEGDPELAEFLREVGFEVVDGPSGSPGPPEGTPPDAFLITAQGDAAVTAASRATATVRRGGVVAIPVAGGDPTPPRPVSRGIRALQLGASALTAISAELAGRRVARAMRQSDIEVSRVLTGDRARPRYGLGRGGWIRRLRLPIGSIVTGAAHGRRRSVIEAATDRAGRALGSPLTRRSANVFESGKLAVEFVDSEGAAYYLWLAAGRASKELDRRRNAVQAILRENAPPPVRDRILEPIAAGQVGPADYVLEPKASGAHPFWMTPRLWQDCLEFLTALHRLPRRAPALGLGRSWPDLELGVEFLATHVGSEEGRTLERVHDEISNRVSGVPVGGGHGDFWRKNLIVRRGRLRAVLDWEWAAADSLPLLDLMDLIAHSGLRRPSGLPPGPAFTEVLWPLAQRGGDERVRLYCEETDTPCDARTLEGLTMAHWLLRTARAGLNRPERLQYRGWLGDNIESPLTHLRAAIEARRGARPEHHPPAHPRDTVR
jgi:hypothetical protein